MRTRRYIVALMACMLWLGALAGPVDEARKLYREGNYQAAIDLMQPQLKRSPRDGNVNFFLGASLYHLGRYSEAVKPLQVAEGKSVADAAEMLAIIDLDNYNPDGAEEHLDAWREILRKNKKSAPARMQDLASRLVKLRNMLERVEKIEVLDSLTVDSATFFEYYKLSRPAGRLLPPDAVNALGARGNEAQLSVAYLPENHSELLWAEADSAGVFALYGADILDDGTLDHTAPLDESLAEGASACFPFLMPDGMTLYYANNGSGSLGGYDIFMTRRTDADSGGSEYMQPQNMGMPYNSPFNDFMLAIDELSGLGWWATDRNQIPGKVTIYVFAPSQVRVNVEPDDPNLAALAKLSDISLTRTDGVDYAEKLAAALALAEGSDSGSSDNSSPRFVLDMGNGKVYTSLNEFRSERARAAMLEALVTEANLERQQNGVVDMRARWRRGDTSLTNTILEAEQRTEDLRRTAREARNNAIRLENSNN